MSVELVSQPTIVFTAGSETATIAADRGVDRVSSVQTWPPEPSVAWQVHSEHGPAVGPEPPHVDVGGDEHLDRRCRGQGARAWSSTRRRRSNRILTQSRPPPGSGGGRSPPSSSSTAAASIISTARRGGIGGGERGSDLSARRGARRRAARRWSGAHAGGRRDGGAGDARSHRRLDGVLVARRGQCHHGRHPPRPTLLGRRGPLGGLPRHGRPAPRSRPGRTRYSCRVMGRSSPIPCRPSTSW